MHKIISDDGQIVDVEAMLARTSPEQFGVALEQWAREGEARHQDLMAELRPKYRAMGFTFQERW